MSGTGYRPYRAAIFDLDGTLLDSMDVWLEVDRIFLARRGLQLPDDYAAAISPMGFPAAAAYTKNRFSLPEDESAIMAEWHALAVDAYAHRVELKPYALDYLHSLRKRRIPLAAATASQAVFYMPALRRLGIDTWFSSITEISEVSRGKGHPDIYLRAAEKLGCTPMQCVVFEDILPGIRGASAGGFYTVGVRDDHSSDQTLLRALADRYIEDYRELLINDVF